MFSGKKEGCCTIVLFPLFIYGVVFLCLWLIWVNNKHATYGKRNHEIKLDSF
jgi:uncharacterized membrane protein